MYFTNLDLLNCSGNKLTALDVSKNTKLTELDCFGNKLKKLLRKYAKPQSIKFNKSSMTIRVHNEVNLLAMLRLNPSTCFYPIKYTCSPTGIVNFVYLEGNEMVGWFEGIKPGVTTITAKCGGKTAKIKITVVE